MNKITKIFHRIGFLSHDIVLVEAEDTGRELYAHLTCECGWDAELVNRRRQNHERVPVIETSIPVTRSNGNKKSKEKQKVVKEKRKTDQVIERQASDMYSS